MSSEKLGNTLLVGWGDGDDNDDDCDDNEEVVVEEQQTLFANSNKNDLCNDSLNANNQHHDPTTSTTNNHNDEINTITNESTSRDHWNNKQSSINLGRNVHMNSFDDASNDGILTRDEIFGEKNNADDDVNRRSDEHELGMNNDLDNDFDDEEDDDEMNVLNTIHVNKKETLFESMNSNEKNENTINETNTTTTTTSTTASSTLWSRFTTFGMKQSTQEENDHSGKGLLENEQHKDEEEKGELETNHLEHQHHHQDTYENDAKEHKSDDNVSSTSTFNNNNDSIKNTPIIETPIVMKNAIEGFGSHNHHPQSNKINNNDSASSSYSGIGGFFRSIQLQRLKAKQQFDPFSLTQEELDILKEDIRSKYDDLQTMDTAISATTSSSNPKNMPSSSTSASVLTGNLGKDKQPGLKEHVQAAILAPEAFSEYVDRLVEDDDGEDNMGVYRTVPLCGDKDIADDYVLRQKEMKPMKMEGNNELTWSDVAEALNENMVIDEETFLEDLDPQGNYRRILPIAADGEEEDEDKTGEEGFETIREMEKLRRQIMKLNGRIQSLEEQLKSKDDEIAAWKEKCESLEKKTKDTEASKTVEVDVKKVVEENFFEMEDFEATKIE